MLVICNLKDTDETFEIEMCKFCYLLFLFHKKYVLSNVIYPLQLKVLLCVQYCRVCRLFCIGLNWTAVLWVSRKKGYKKTLHIINWGVSFNKDIKETQQNSYKLLQAISLIADPHHQIYTYILYTCAFKIIASHKENKYCCWNKIWILKIIYLYINVLYKDKWFILL